MDASLILNNFLTPPILFFFLGMVATWVKSDLEIPAPVPRVLSIYLLFAIGIHGGAELAASGLSGQALSMLGAAVVASAAMPVWSFFILRRRMGIQNAAAIAATYGSISAVTFITAASFLSSQDVSYGGHMVAAMALMESPAIVVGVLLARLYALPEPGQTTVKRAPLSELWRESCLNGAVLLLLGSLAIGLLTGERGWAAVRGFASDPFTGVLCLFLLDMGLVAARRLRDLRRSGAFLATFAIVGPVIHAMIGIGVAWLMGAGVGDALLLAVLFGSASYIAVPAAMRLALPQANPSIYLPMALAITFPFNIIVGIPLYLAMINALWGWTWLNALFGGT